RINAIHATGPMTYLITWDSIYEYSRGGLRMLDLPGEGTFGAVAGDGSSGLLVMREGEGLLHYDGQGWNRIGAGAIPAHGATSLLRDADGSLWIGYNGSRVVRWHR